MSISARFTHTQTKIHLSSVRHKRFGMKEGLWNRGKEIRDTGGGRKKRWQGIRD